MSFWQSRKSLCLLEEYLLFPDIKEYFDLGEFWSVEDITTSFAALAGCSEDKVRVLVMVPGSGRAQTTEGCPSFKEVVRREDETVLVMARRTVHTCWMFPSLQVVAIVLNDIMSSSSCSTMMDFFSTKIGGQSNTNKVNYFFTSSITCFPCLILGSVPRDC